MPGLKLIQVSNRGPMYYFVSPNHSKTQHMMTSSNGNIFRVTGHLCGEFTGPRWIPHTKAMQWRGALMFSLIFVWINGWVNNREAGDLRRHRAHYDVIVMKARNVCIILRAHVDSRPHSLALERYECNAKVVVFKGMSGIDILGI